MTLRREIPERSRGFLDQFLTSFESAVKPLLRRGLSDTREILSAHRVGKDWGSANRANERSRLRGVVMSALLWFSRRRVLVCAVRLVRDQEFAGVSDPA